MLERGDRFGAPDGQDNANDAETNNTQQDDHQRDQQKQNQSVPGKIPIESQVGDKKHQQDNECHCQAQQADKKAFFDLHERG
jgi:hypothetical protein